ncbi:MAG: molecular chaperone HtpG, partial [Ectothiorhodospira sp.]
MKEGQDTIYYITADTHTAALNSPHLEVFRKRGIEVLLLSDRVDEWLVAHLTEFEGKSLKSVAKGDLDLGEAETEEEKKAQQEAEEQVKDLLPRIQEALGERVQEVRFSHRLTDSPACIVLSENEMALYMQQLLKQAGQHLPDTKPVLEVNPGHRLIQRMDQEADAERFGDWARLLLDQAILAEGGQLEDPAGFVRRLNTLITNA